MAARRRGERVAVTHSVNLQTDGIAQRLEEAAAGIRCLEVGQLRWRGHDWQPLDRPTLAESVGESDAPGKRVGGGRGRRHDSRAAVDSCTLDGERIRNCCPRRQSRVLAVAHRDSCIMSRTLQTDFASTHRSSRDTVHQVKSAGTLPDARCLRSD